MLLCGLLFCRLADDHQARDGGFGRLLGRLLGHGGIFAQPGAPRHFSALEWEPGRWVACTWRQADWPPGEGAKELLCWFADAAGTG